MKLKPPEVAVGAGFGVLLTVLSVALGWNLNMLELGLSCAVACRVSACLFGKPNMLELGFSCVAACGVSAGLGLDPNPPKAGFCDGVC